MKRREFLLSSGLVTAGGLLNISAFSRSVPFKEYRDYDALGLAELLRKGDVSALELLETAIARVETIDSAINAVVLRHYDLASAGLACGMSSSSVLIAGTRFIGRLTLIIHSADMPPSTGSV